MISSTRLRNSGRKCPRTTAHHFLLDRLHVFAFPEVDEIFGAEVRGHDDEHVAEIDRAALAVSEPSIVEHLQQDVEHVRMRFLDFVKQHDLIRPPPHRLGQSSAFLVADIAGRGADKPGDRVLLHIFGHVDAHERALVIEQERRKRLGELGLADAGWAQEHE